MLPYTLYGTYQGVGLSPEKWHSCGHAEKFGIYDRHSESVSETL